jgi:hypothetical protein
MKDKGSLSKSKRGMKNSDKNIKKTWL